MERSRLAHILTDCVEANPELFASYLEEAGISIVFLRNYIEANICDILVDCIFDASEIGEYHCIECNNYFNKHDMATIDNDASHESPSGKGICWHCQENKE